MKHLKQKAKGGRGNVCSSCDLKARLLNKAMNLSTHQPIQIEGKNKTLSAKDICLQMHGPI